MRYIDVLETALGQRAEKRYLPLQPGDVADTFADVSALARDIGYQPSTPIEVGVGRFVEWYRNFYGDTRIR
jgi:UDP-glucuronate 4-epimerase